MDLWGPGRSMLTTDDLAATTIELLTRGRGALDAQSQRTVTEVEATLGIYANRLYFLEGMKYVTLLEADVAAMRPLDAAAQTEGGESFEGVLLAHFGMSTSAAVTTARAHWHGAASDLHKLVYLRDVGTAYAELHTAALNGLAQADLDTQRGAVARVRATVDVLVEALQLAGQDPAALRNTADLARMQVDDGNAAMAAMTLGPVRDAIASIGAASP
jgi:hypothetical protein